MFTYDRWYRIKEIGIKNSISRNDLNQLHMFVLELLSDIVLQFVITLKVFLKLSRTFDNNSRNNRFYKCSKVQNKLKDLF